MSVKLADNFQICEHSIDGKSILTLYYSTLQKVHKSKKNFYFNHPKDLHTGTVSFNKYMPPKEEEGGIYFLNETSACGFT
jgi:hypothetical protein